MGDWKFIVPQLRPLIDQWAALLSKTPEGVLLAATLLPIAFAIFSKRWAEILGCILLAVVALCVLIAPSNTAATLATGFYFGSLIVALSAIRARRNVRGLKAEVASVREELEGLLRAEQSRLLRHLRSSGNERGSSTSDGKPSPNSGERGQIDPRGSEREGK